MLSRGYILPIRAADETIRGRENVRHWTLCRSLATAADAVHACGRASTRLVHGASRVCTTGRAVDPELAHLR